METHMDSSPFTYGTHGRGNNSANLVDPGALFKSLGVRTGVLIKNTTDGSEGTITAVTDDEVTATLTGGTDNDWDVGDEYEIYNTATYNSVISRNLVDRSRGWRVMKDTQLDRGWRVEDVDLDRDERHVFGPGQPEKSHGRHK